MIKDLVSIVMPTYNDAKYLDSAIQDILHQTYTNFEFIIVNDGSTDNTQEILESYAAKDKRIIILNKKNGGTGSALNVGFNNAKGEFGTWISSDDNKENNYIERLVSFLKENRDIESVCAAFESKYLGKIFKPYIYYSDETILRDPSGVRNDGTTTKKSFIVDDWAEINNIQCFLGVCYMFTMRLKRKCGDYLQIPGEDYHMAMKMAFNSRMGYIDEKLGTHNNPPDSLSMQNRNCVAEANKLTREFYNSQNKWNLSKIPKIANFYWGSENMSFMRYLTIKSFKKYNPDWSIHLYVPKSLSKNKTWEKVDQWHQQDSSDSQQIEDYYKLLLEEEAVKVIPVDFSNTPLGNESSEAHKSDYLRWNILYQNGGLWSDMDILYFKSMKDIRQNKNPSSRDLDSIVCYDHRHNNLPAIGFLLTAKGNEFYKQMSIKSRKHYDPLNYECIGSRLFSSISENLVSMNNKFKIKNDNFNVNEVYKYDFKNLDSLFQEDKFAELVDDSIGVHWYGGHPLSQEYNRSLTSENYVKLDNTLKTIINKILLE